MGFLGLGDPFTYEETEKHRDYIKSHGIDQFLHNYKNYVEDDYFFLWGDEIEYTFVNLDATKRISRVSLKYNDFIQILNNKGSDVADFHPEYAEWMLEGTPSRPYENSLKSLLEVENNMLARRVFVNNLLPPTIKLFTIVVFPLLGVGDYCLEPIHPNGEYGQSKYIGDESINRHPRFLTLTKHIRDRRGSKVDIQVPIYRDENTSQDMEMIDMDSMAFGMGSCSLQVTFQSKSEKESRGLYDQITVLAPIIGALSCAGPIWRGYLSDIDCRWDIIAQSVDDRTEDERNPSSDQYISKPRYGSVSRYIGVDDFVDQYNDLKLRYNKDVYNKLINNGIDESLSRHFSHLFIRDPLVIFKNRLELDDKNCLDHFENIQSTNWQSARWKPPPLNSKVKSYRVELRTLDVQITDFENAAYTVFSALLNRALIFFQLNLYMPISKVDINIQRSQMRDSVNSQKFYFRKYICPFPGNKDVCNECIETDIKTILFGQKSETCPRVGLMILIRAYLACIETDLDDLNQVKNYLKLIGYRAIGKVSTGAKWIRNFVLNHPKYKKDSIVSEEINYDLMKRIDELANGGAHDVDLLGPVRVNAIDQVEDQPVLLRGSSFHIPEQCPKESYLKLEQYIKNFYMKSSNDIDIENFLEEEWNDNICCSPTK